jgi:hypothetical protein
MSDEGACGGKLTIAHQGPWIVLEAERDNGDVSNVYLNFAQVEQLIDMLREAQLQAGQWVSNG